MASGTGRPDPRHPFPILRGAALAWFVPWFLTYAHVWGFLNFLHLCDVAVILTCIGLWTGSALLLSAQALSSLVLDGLWILDAGWRLLAGHHPIGGTEYMFEPRHPLGVRLLSLFHVLLPGVLLWGVRRLGYDRRALGLQSAIAAVAMAASRLFAGPEANINYVYRDPIFHRTFGPAPLHLLVVFATLVVAVYLPTHLLLSRYAQREP